MVEVVEPAEHGGRGQRQADLLVQLAQRRLLGRFASVDAPAGQRPLAGVPAQVLDARGVAALDPGVTMDIAGGVFFPKDCHLSPGRFMAGLLAECERMGVNFHWATDVKSVIYNGRTVEALETTAGEIAAAARVSRHRTRAGERSGRTRGETRPRARPPCVSFNAGES